ncbi:MULTISPECIES: hypothetical protein [Flavobacterium]|uniref:Uncharacterized protein n=1 Tax=Flavobacterium alkalisoli TaxID=2602769 RepID=A0A5B9FVY3_9FLAO|nr:hypothetical protein [Flavobacterium alkalisoli]QEE50331.1 hypothetical protein FUA48_12305 [Flavobacterium alkalisoli]
MKLKSSQLIKLNVRYAVHENELYFDVLEIKDLFPEKKFPPDKIKSLPIGGVYVNTIRAEDIEDMTDFDKTMVQFMKAKPK